MSLPQRSENHTWCFIKINVACIDCTHSLIMSERISVTVDSNDGSADHSSRSIGSDQGSIEAGTDPSHATEQDTTPMVNVISDKATKKVLHMKLLVIAILIVSAFTLAVCAYSLIKKSETKQFESKFGYDAHKVLEAIGSSIDKSLGLLDSLAVTLVSYASDKDDKWPFVTLPDFGLRMAKLLPQTDAITLAILPIVKPELRDAWEAYSIQNDEWVNQSIAIEDNWDRFYGPIVYDWEKYGTIYGDFGDIESNVRYVHKIERSTILIYIDLTGTFPVIVV